MENYSIREARAKLGEIIDKIKAGEIVSIKGVEIQLVHSGTQQNSKSGTQVVHSEVKISQKDKEEIANIVYAKVKSLTGTHLVHSQNEVVHTGTQLSPTGRDLNKFNELKEQMAGDYGKVEVFGEQFNTHVEVDWRAISGDEGYAFGDKWVKMSRVEAMGMKIPRERMREIEEEIDLPMAPKTAMHPKAVKMNDGSNPIPKPVKKKKSTKE